MTSWRRSSSALGLRDPRSVSRLSSILGTGLLFCLALGSSYVLLPRLGLEMFAISLIGLVLGLVYLIISFKSLTVPFYMTVLSVGGLRFIWSIQTPMLPDLYLDRMMLIWLIVIFTVKLFAEGKVPKRPYGLDLLILAHGTYLLLQIWAYGFNAFSLWTRSILTPYLMYFFAKNIFQSRRQVEVLFFLLLLLGVYYNVTSIGQKLHADVLVYPASIRTGHLSYYGRSVGPFGNPAVFGNIIGMILPLNLYFLATVKKNFLKPVIMLNMGMGFLGLYFTYTRGPWLCGAAGMAAVVILNRKYYLKYFIPLLVIAPIVGIGFLGLGHDKFMKERVENEETIGARLGTAVTALRVWRDHPFLGCGFFRYPIVRQSYIEPVDIPGFETIRFIQFRFNALHDMYLGSLAEDGLIGTGLVFGIFFMIARVYVKKYRLRKQGDHFATFIIPLFVGIMVIYLVGGLFISYRYFSIMGTMLFSTAGIANGYQPGDGETASLVHGQQ